MSRAIRIDAGTLRAPVEMANGFLRVDGLIARPGIYEYRNTAADEKDGLGPVGKIRRELRPRDEVSKPSALAGFEGMSVTNDHPSTMVTPKNARALEVGTVSGPARMDGNEVAATMVLKDPKTIAAVKAKKLAQLSPGYKIREDRTPGVDPEFGPYDLVQRDITPNHLALVDRSRGGADLRLRMDGVSIEERETTTRFDAAEPRRENMTMTLEEQIASLKAQLTEAETKAETNAGAVAVHRSRADKAEALITTRDERVKELEAIVAAGATEAETHAIKEQRERADKAEAALGEEKARYKTDLIAERETTRKAHVVMGPGFRTDSMPIRQVRIAVISHLRPKEDVSDEKSDEYLASRFDALCDERDRSARSLVRAGESLTIGDRKDGADRGDSRETRAAAWRNQALTGLPGHPAKKKEEE